MTKTEKLARELRLKGERIAERQKPPIIWTSWDSMSTGNYFAWLAIARHVQKLIKTNNQRKEK